MFEWNEFDNGEWDADRDEPATVSHQMKLDTIECANAPDYLRSLPDASVDAIISDPIYPEIDRPYGRISEAEWLDLMRAVVTESRRVLKPHGSAVFILQPNMENIGKMRLWLWRFMVWCGEYWNIVQDAYWWNIATMPTSAATQYQLMRQSVKYAVWVGNAECYRDQEAVLWLASDTALALKKEDMALRYNPGGNHRRPGRIAQAIEKRGGVTPFNLLPLANTNSASSAGANGHGAGTPSELVAWWIRYLTKRGDVVVDPFMGSGTTALVAKSMDRHYLGCDKMQAYVDTANARLLEVSTNHQTVMW